VPDLPAAALVVSETDPSRAIRLQPSRHYRSERDYEWSLPPPSRPRPEPPAAVLPYLQESEPRSDEGSYRQPDPETDPLTALARGLLRQAKGFQRHQLLATSDPFLASWRAAQDARLSATLARKGIDWASVSPGPPPPLRLTLERLEPASGAAAQATRIRGVVKNVGATPAFRVRAVIESDDPAFDEAELVFGKIAPGQSKSYDLQSGPARNVATHPRMALLHAKLIAADQPLTGTADLLIDLPGAPQSTLSFRYQIREGAEGSNHDGRIERGERIQIPVTVTNAGSAALARLRAGLVSQRSGQWAAMPAGSFDIGELAPGASRTVTFVAAISPAPGPDHCDLELELEPDSGDSITHAIRIDLSQPASTVAAGGAAPAAVEVNPPRLTVRGPALATGDTVRVEGTAADARGVRDLYIRVWNRTPKIPVRKVFYQLNQPSDAPELNFRAEVPVTPGMNLIQVFARHSTEAMSVQTLVVLRMVRPGPSGPPPD
jgi:carboxyl-terminal processing protease